MNGTGVYDFKLEYTFAGDYMAELDRQLALLLSTREGTMPLDREFGLNKKILVVAGAFHIAGLMDELQSDRKQSLKSSNPEHVPQPRYRLAE